MKERSFGACVSGKALLAALVCGVAVGAYADYDDNLAWKYEGGTTPVPASTQAGTQSSELNVFAQAAKDAAVGETLETRPFFAWLEKFAYEYQQQGLLLFIR